jgi:hypothetical protein
VLDYDATAGYSINSTKSPAPKGSTISLYVTGMGDLTPGSTITVTDSSTPKLQASQILPLVINPSPAVTATLTLTLVPIPLVQYTSSVTALLAVGGTPPYIWSVTSGLPAGMTMSSSGVLSGTPTDTVDSPFSLQVSVSDSATSPLVTTGTYTVTVAAPTVTVTTSQLVPGVVGVTYPPITLTATGGKGSYTWSATGLPLGLNLNPTTGVLNGIPTTATTILTDSPAFTAMDSSGVPSTAIITLDVLLLHSMTITTQTLPNGVVGVPYLATTLQQQGGTAPINWICSPCAGLTLNLTTGVLSGTPNVPAATITITAIDSTGPPGAAFTYHVNIAAPLSVTPVSLPPSSQYVTYYPALTMQSAGGIPPYTWTASGLPLGMTMSSSGVLSGVPTVPFYLPLPDGAVALGAVYVADNTYRVEINGQAAVTSYAGASQGSVAGLTQINAIVPPTAPTGGAIPLVVYIGKSNSARASQLSVTLAVQ